MRIIHRYILREVFYYFFLILLIFTTILVAKEIYDTRDEILDDNPKIVDVFQYVFLSIPGPIVDGIPLISMFAVLFSVGLMARNREITALVAAGVTFNQLALPIAIYGVIVTAGSFWFSDSVAPAALSHARYLLQVRIKGQNQFSVTGNDEIFRKGEGNRFYIMANFDGNTKVMRNPIILDRNADGDGLSQRIEAERGEFIEDEGGGTYWEFEKAERWTFNEDGTAVVEKFDEPLRIKMEEKLDSFLTGEKSPERMSSSELGDYATILKRQGNSAEHARYATLFHAKFAMPIACLLLGLVGFSVSADLRRHFVLAFAVGLAMGVGYYLLREAMVGMGSRDFIPPVVAAWSPVAIFGLLVTGLLHRLTTVH